MPQSNPNHTDTMQADAQTMPKEDWSISKLLTVQYPDVPLRKRFRQTPILEQVTLRQVLQGPFALQDFLDQCRREPQCGDMTIRHLRDVIARAADSMSQK